jgi:hypothetical protein
MANLEELLKKNLHRAACPDPIEVGEYYVGSLKPERARQVAAHLEQCPFCHNELGILKNYLSLVHADLQPGLGEQIKIWIARLLPPPAPDLQLAFAVRGEQAGGPARYEIGDDTSAGELDLESQDDPAAPGQKTLVGLVLGMDTRDLTARLWQSGSPVGQCTVDEFGNLALEHLAQGCYDLIISSPEFEIHVLDVQV